MRVIMGQKGTTLAEIMVAMVIGIIIVLGIYQFYYIENKSFVVQDRVADIQASVRSAFKILTDRMTEGGYDPTQANINIGYRFGFIPNVASTGLAAGGVIENISNAVVLWTQDDNGNGVVDQNEVRGFRFNNNRIFLVRLAGGNLTWMEFVGSPTKPGDPGEVQSLQFTYQTNNGLVIADPLTQFQNIRKVRVVVSTFKVVQPDPIFPANTLTRRLESDVTIRNRSYQD